MCVYYCRTYYSNYKVELRIIRSDAFFKNRAARPASASALCTVTHEPAGMARTQTAPVPGYAAAGTRARTTMRRLGIATFRARHCLATGAWAGRTFVSRVLTTCGMHGPVPRACPTSHPCGLCAARWIFNGLETPVSYYWRPTRGASAARQQQGRARGRSAAGPRHSGHGDLDSRRRHHV